MAERRRRLAVLAAALAAALLAGVAFSPVGQTAAAWNDREFARATLTVAALPSVANFACPADGATFTWTTPSAPYPGAVLSGYEFSYVQIGTSNTPTKTNLPASATSTSIAPSGLVLLASYRVSISAKYGNWVSPPATRTLNVVLEVLGVKIFTCGA